MQDLADLDEEFKEVHLGILERFYLLFESIYKYIKDFERFLQDLEDGVFIQHTFEVTVPNLRYFDVPRTFYLIRMVSSFWLRRCICMA